ncbi:hypothetical protein DW322_19845 [Rhodococcus rhodnii]|uniref:Uncharacterized protein n=2 Tax=Rhodococcus rhodnii TaxID=38312 RepID=R7WN11_9NOCA|nr:hypothetical protein [Rhodococcus rhodnii]EOM76692.1 hypothetical protein Rrhod_1969 [Rhodococcus rhodnii LMG 5362]TXG92014.1 hypothetical protein DW322_19845 [Rhodococcus rhodnii]
MSGHSAVAAVDSEGDLVNQPYPQPRSFPEQQPPPSPQRGGPRRIVLVALVVVAVIAAGTWIGVSFASDRDAGVDSSAYESASSPAERLEAAMDIMIDSGPMRITITSGSAAGEVQVDYGSRQAHLVLPDDTFGSFEYLMTGEDVLLRFGSAALGAEADTWYRAASDDPGPFAAMVNSFDPDYLKAAVTGARGVETDGTETVDGVTTTRYVVTPDNEALVDETLAQMGDLAVLDDPSLRAQVLASMPTTMTYSVDDDGRIRLLENGGEEHRYHDFGAPLELPDVDPATVQEFPGF